MRISQRDKQTYLQTLSFVWKFREIGNFRQNGKIRKIEGKYGNMRKIRDIGDIMCVCACVCVC